MPTPEVDELLSTGEAASLLGVSRQHIVNLCNRGALPSTTTGSHRRIRRQDLAALNPSATPDQRRSWLLGIATAAATLEDPDGAIGLATTNLDTMRAAHGDRAAQWLDEWAALLHGPLDDILAALTARTPHSAELRQNSPFAGLIDERTRRDVLAASKV